MEPSVSDFPIVEAAVLRPFQAVLRREGAPPEGHMRRAGLSPDQVAAGDGWIPKAQAYGYMETASRGEGIPDLGYRVGRAHGLDALGSLAPRLRACETLKEAIDTLATHVRRLATDNRVWLTQAGRHTWLHNDSGDTSLRGSEHGVQLGAMILLHLLRAADGLADWTPGALSLESAPPVPHFTVPEFASARIGYYAPSTAIRFPAEFLTRSLTVSGGGGSSGGLTIPPSGFGAALTDVIHARMSLEGVPGVDIAAEMCGVSPRTLQRRLAGEGLSYRQVCDRSRFRKAVELLENPRTTVNDIAAELSYSDRRSFLRAFRRFTGMTPSEYRQLKREP
jgi:AraC-like DNA-binding protein